jgi:hypothetical protein
LPLLPRTRTIAASLARALPLVEGIAATVMQKVPPERRGAAAGEAVRLLRARLETCGAI